MSQTFTIRGNQLGEPYIECLVCGSKSFHPEDIRQEYCGSCHQFHFVIEQLLAADPDWRPDAG